MNSKNTYKSKIKEFRVAPDLYLALLNNFTLSTDTILKGIDKRYIQFYFCSKGSLVFNFNHGDYKVRLTDGNSFLYYYPNLDVPLSLNINAESKVFIIAISFNRLNELFRDFMITDETIANLSDNRFYLEREISTSVKFIIQQVEQINLSVQFENLFLTSKIYELLANYFSEIREERINHPNENYKHKKIKEIKDFLIADFKNPPSIKELCYKFEISEYHLKEGFRQLYNSTIYGYLLEKKLEYALQKLMNGKFKIKEIAFEIGYENPSHFISAFKKKYKLTPKQFILQNN